MNRDEALAELVRLGAAPERAAECLELAGERGAATAVVERLEVIRCGPGAYIVRTF